jgi:arabinofuranan 3-O-arabinosyltransferase
VLDLPAGTLTVVAEPTSQFRVDTLRLDRVGATPARTQQVSVDLDADGQAGTVTLPERDTASVLTLPQNLNAGWRAEIDGQELTATRSAGWMQAWRVPAGPATEVTLVYAPGPQLLAALGDGVVGLVLVLGAALVPARRTAPERAALVGGRPGLLDLVTVVVATGLVAGWWGLAAAAVAIAAGLVLRRDVAWAWFGAACLLVVGATLGAASFAERSWAVDWQQGWSLAALACAIAALAGARRPAGVRIRTAPPAAPRPRRGRWPRR